MRDYSFSTLNDREFEILVRDLLNAEFGFDLQSFKSGKDKGIDVREASASNPNGIVGQVKHYVRATYSDLKNKLRSEELPKIQALNADRFLLITSLPLGPIEKDELLNLLSPHLTSPDDIFGREDLNKYLANHEMVERNHFKLWYSSATVHTRLLHNAVFGRSEATMQRILRRFPLYVMTERFDEANEILEKEKLLLITGQPGIGKTTLAEMIIADRARLDFEFFTVTNIREAEDVISPDPAKKQLFFIDDFLGEIHLELVSGKKMQGEIADFIDRVRNTPHKYLLLASRTVILLGAVHQYEKLRRTHIAEERFELELTDYTKLQKARILYNHLFFSPLGEDRAKAIVRDRFYWKIINHVNFAPRLIEFITMNKKGQQLKGEDFREFAKKNLDSPEEIWRDSFETEIRYFDQCFLYTLFTFSGTASEERLKKAFKARLEYEKRANNRTIHSDQFRRSLHALLDGFISSTHEAGGRYFRPINPSLSDFMLAEVRALQGNLVPLLSCIVGNTQLGRFDRKESPIRLNNDEQAVIFQKVVNDEIENQTHISSGVNSSLLIRINTLRKYCSDLPLDSAIRQLLDSLNHDDSWNGIWEILRFVGDNKENLQESFTFLKEHFFKCLDDSLEDIHSELEASFIWSVFYDFGYDFDIYKLTDEGRKKMVGLVEEIMTEFQESIDGNKTTYVDPDYVQSLYAEMMDEYESLRVALLDDDRQYDAVISVPDFNVLDWEDQIAENLARVESARIKKHHVDEATGSEADEEIDEMFLRFGALPEELPT